MTLPGLQTVRSPAMSRAALVLVVVAIAVAASAAPVRAQDVRLRDLVVAEGDVPVRLVGYGLVVGLDGTGDRAAGRAGSGHTVRSIVNLLRNFGVDVPADLLRTRNVAAVLVTAETPAYLGRGGRFDVQVASIGDAVSLRGGILWATPLVAEIGGEPLATAQGPLLVSDGRIGRGMPSVETAARLPSGGMLHVAPDAPSFAAASRLILRNPDLATAVRVAAAINTATGDGTAVVQNPGTIALHPPADVDRATFLATLSELRVRPERAAQIVIDVRDGSIAAGGDMLIGPAVVSHGLLTLSVGATAPPSGAPGDVRVAPGASVQDVAAALHAIAAPPAVIAAVFESLRSVGALTAEVVVR
jgi:flagellar P-ring protein precursor FlgI